MPAEKILDLSTNKSTSLPNLAFICSAISPVSVENSTYSWERLIHPFVH